MSNEKENAAKGGHVSGAEDAPAVRVPMTTKEVLDAEEKVPLLIPRPEGDKSSGVFISINEINYMVAFDAVVYVPRSVAQVYYDKQAAEKRADKFVRDTKADLKKKAEAAGGGVY